METTEADRIVMEECGLLSEQQRARLGYRTVKGVRKAEQFLLTQGVPGVSKTIKQSSDPLLSMLALRRSAKQFQTTSMFNPNELVDPSLYAFPIRYPVERLRQRFVNLVLAISGNEDPAELAGEIQETLDLELDEAQARQLMEDRIKTGAYDFGGNPFVNKMVNMMDILKRGDIQGALKGMVSLIDEAKLIRSRKIADDAIFVGQNNQLIGEALEAETLAQTAGKAQADAEYTARLEGAPIRRGEDIPGSFNNTDLVEAYRRRIGLSYGTASRSRAFQLELQGAGLVGLSVFGSLTRREKIAMLRVSYGESDNARDNLLRSLNMIVEDNVKVETEGETRVGKNLIEAVEEDVGLVAE
tara:strand:- start:3447 stop:4517 length:1071 start_codon:yes stop_codon:yes gene_type:complete